MEVTRRQVTAVDRIDGGERHEVHRASFRDAAGDSRRVVVRILRSDLSDDAAMAQREAKVLQKLGGAGAPRLYDFRLRSEWFDTAAMCLDCIEGGSVALAEQSPADLTRLGAVVGRLHAMAVDDLAGWLSPASGLTSYAEDRALSILGKMDSVREPLSETVRARLTRAAAVVEDYRRKVPTMASFQPGGSLCLLHGDIGPGNVLWADDPVLIDWEYTRIGDPADEAAYVFDQNGLDTSRRQAFWVGYQAANPELPIASVKERTEWWGPVQLLGSALWWVERFTQRTAADAAGRSDPAVPGHPQHYLSRVLARLDRFEALAL